MVCVSLSCCEHFKKNKTFWWLLHGFILATEWQRCSRQLDAKILSFFPLWGQFNTVFFTHASTVNLLERVKGPLCALPHLWLILSISMSSFEPTFENICLQHARDWRYNALRLWIKRELLLPENTGFIKASKVITHPCSLAPSSAARRPQTWCWNRCGFWFSVKSGLHC